MRHGIVGALAVAATSVSLLAAGGAVTPARQRDREQTPAFRSGVEVVTVDVGVVDKKGVPLRGLEAADFVVTVDGQPRRVVTAEYLDRAAAGTPSPVEPEPGSVSTNEGIGVGRLFAFIVDESTLDPDGARRAARAADSFFSQLTFVDRSAVMVVPTGPSVPFTWAHEQVRSALLRVMGTGRPVNGWEYGSLSEARDIASRNAFTLRVVGERACGTTPTGATASAPAGAGMPPPPGVSVTPGGGTGGTGTIPGPPTTATGSGSPRGAGSPGGFAATGCLRNVQTQAEMAWRMTQMNSLASLSALRVALKELGRVPGDKTVVLISGGWPLDAGEEISTLSIVAAEASAARVTLFTIFVPMSSLATERAAMAFSPVADSHLYLGPLENLAAMTGGGSFRADVGAEATFERLSRELSGYYRLGIERAPADGDDRSRRLKVQVLRGGVRVRAREIFDVRTYADRDWTARLASAIDGPIAATGLGLRVTSFLAVDPDDRSRMRLLLAGEVSRAQAGDATLHLLVSDVDGKKVAAGDAALALAGGDVSPFSANVAVPQGRYIVRVGVMDSAGRVGSADHRVDVSGVRVGSISASGPVLVRVPADGAGDPRFLVDQVGRNERLAFEVGLEGDPERLADAEVEFEISTDRSAPALLREPATLSSGPRDSARVAQAFANMRVLPPGPYLVTAKIRSGGAPLGEVRRGFTLVGAGAATAGAGSPAPASSRGRAGARPDLRPPFVAFPSFTLDEVLGPPVLDMFLDRVASRPDAAGAGVRDLFERARAAGLGSLVVPEPLVAETPVAAFLKGLALLSRRELDPAASAFRDAMRASADFYPAMVYLGACYAAAGNDKAAAAVWRTALIREGDAIALHRLLADALLRQNRADLAVDDLDAVRARWPEDRGMRRRFVMAALLAGRQLEALQALDADSADRADDEPALALALFMLYVAFDTGEPIESAAEDRERMQRLAARYRAVGGPSLALVDTWVTAAAGKQP